MLQTSSPTALILRAALRESLVLEVAGQASRQAQRAALEQAEDCIMEVLQSFVSDTADFGGVANRALLAAALQATVEDLCRGLSDS